jgi:glycogen debranching enzyme
MSGDNVSVLDGSALVVSDHRGDIDADPNEPQGLFVCDLQFLSHWRLTMEGHVLEVLSTDDLEYDTAQFFLYPPTGPIYQNPVVSVIRKRCVSDGLHEDLHVLNHSSSPVALRLRVDASADFADLRGERRAGQERPLRARGPRRQARARLSTRRLRAGDSDYLQRAGRV